MGLDGGALRLLEQVRKVRGHHAKPNKLALADDSKLQRNTMEFRQQGMMIEAIFPNCGLICG